MNGFNSRDFQSRFGVYSRKSDGMRHRLATQSFDGLFPSFVIYNFRVSEMVSIQVHIGWAHAAALTRNTHANTTNEEERIRDEREKILSVSAAGVHCVPMVGRRSYVTP